MSQPRRPNQLRPVTLERFKTGVPGSVVISQGGTRVLCTAAIDAEVPSWMKPKPGEQPTRGWVTAEYAMLPGSTAQRKRRGSDGRATEIQRLIGRTLRAAVDLTRMPGLSVTCDCDVLAADGGTRTASITGAFVALSLCLEDARRRGLLTGDPITSPVAAVSVGIVDGVPRLDLDYEFDSRADVDMNVAMNARGRFIEVQGSAEGGTFDRKELDRLLALAGGGIRQLLKIQQQFLRKRG